MSNKEYHHVGTVWKRERNGIAWHCGNCNQPANVTETHRWERTDDDEVYYTCNNCGKPTWNYASMLRPVQEKKEEPKTLDQLIAELM